MKSKIQQKDSSKELKIDIDKSSFRNERNSFKYDREAEANNRLTYQQIEPSPLSFRAIQSTRHS